MDTRTDNQESEMEKAEGSRENVNLPQTESVNSGGDTGAPMERGAGQESHPDRPIPEGGGGGKGKERPGSRPSPDKSDAGGISNRPLEQEEENQSPRGRNK